MWSWLRSVVQAICTIAQRLYSVSLPCIKENHLWGRMPFSEKSITDMASGLEDFTTSAYTTSEIYQASNGIPKCPRWYFLSILLFNGVLWPAGLTGNVLTIIILRRKWQKSATQLLLSYLTMADIMTSSVYSGLVMVGLYFGLAEDTLKLQHLSAVSLVYVANTGFIFNQMSISATVLVTWQRYLSVCIPHRAKQYGSHRLMSIAVACSVLFSIVFYLPNYFQYQLSVSHGMFVVSRSSFAGRQSFTVFYSIVLSYLINYFIPITFLIYMATGLIKALWQNTKKTNQGLSKAKEELTLSIIIVIIIFIICQSFGPIRRILQWVYHPYNLAARCGGPLLHFAYLPILTQVFNSSTNFVVYLLCTRGFRKNLISLFTTKKTLEDDSTRSTNNGSGSNTAQIVVSSTVNWSWTFCLDFDPLSFVNSLLDLHAFDYHLLGYPVIYQGQGVIIQIFDL